MNLWICKMWHIEIGSFKNWHTGLEKHSKIVQRPYTLTHCDIPQTLSRDVTQWFLLQNPAPGLQVFQAPVPYSETDSDFHLCPIPTYFKKDHATNPHSATQRRYLDREVNIIAEIYLCDYETHVDNFISKVYLVLISWENELNLQSRFPNLRMVKSIFFSLKMKDQKFQHFNV